MFETEIKDSYITLKSIYISKDTGLQPGKVKLLVRNKVDFFVEGTLSAKGILSGMAKLYKELNLQKGDKIQFSVNEGNIMIEKINNNLPATSTVPSQQRPQTVFDKKNLSHIHIEPFRPENLDHWEPENETDVYLAFGVLQEYTDYQYCCAVSKSLLGKLSAQYSDTAKPDAILIDRTTDQYLMAEWKKFSSDFKSNHKPEDVDVLICWIDDVREDERNTLPEKVLALSEVAKKAAQEIFGSE